MVEEKGLMPEQIYNADSTGLLWKCLRQRTLVFSHKKSAPGFKKAKDMLFPLHFIYCLINIHIFDNPDSRLSVLFAQVPTSPDNRGPTVRYIDSGLSHRFEVVALMLE